MESIDCRPQERLQHQDARSRHSHWCAIVVFSTMALAAITSRFDTDGIQNETKEVKWVVSAMCTTLFVSVFCAVALFVLKESPALLAIEGGLSMLTTALCAAALPFVMDPDHGLAVTSRYGGISNPTLYFFSGLVFITSFFATTGFLFGFYSEWCKQRPCVYYHSSSSRWMWVALVLTGFVVMMTATRMMIEGHCCNVDKSGIPRDWTDLTLPTKDVCNRLKVATGIGSVSFVLSVAWSLINMFLTEETSDKMQMADTGVVEVLFALWTFGATWLTFDDVKSPAKDMGNLFFFTWASWILVLVMAMNSFHCSVTAMTLARQDTLLIPRSATWDNVLSPLPKNAMHLDSIKHAVGEKSRAVFSPST